MGLGRMADAHKAMQIQTSFSQMRPAGPHYLDAFSLDLVFECLGAI
jgi:hypothetical protein